METIVMICSVYGKWLSVWWWLPLAIVTFLARFVYLLKEDDATLSNYDALEFIFIGLFSLLPYERNHISLLDRIDFNMRWKSVGVYNFGVSAFISSLFCFFLMPIAFLFTLRIILKR